MTSSETAWAAGLFEGEGAAMLERSGRPRLSLKMVEESSVQRFLEAVGGGKVYGPYQARAPEARDGYKRRPFWFWVAVGADALAVSELLRPYLSRWRLEAIERWYSSRGNGRAA